jgi:hypothetical protein
MIGVASAYGPGASGDLSTVLQYVLRRSYLYGYSQIRRLMKINDSRSEPTEIGQKKDFERKNRAFYPGFPRRVFKILHRWESCLY